MEKKFKNEDFPFKEGFKIKKGDKPIIISAPHSVSQFRNGKHKHSECITGVIAELLHQHTGCYVIYKTKNLKDDANYDKNHPYKEKIVNLVKENNIKYLIDLHIMSPKREFLIDIATNFGQNVPNNKNFPLTLQKNYIRLKNNRIAYYFLQRQCVLLSSYN